MKRLLAAIPVMALFTACSALQPSTTLPAEANAAQPADIPTVVIKRAAKYTGTQEHSVNYALKNSRIGTTSFQETVKRASFVREDGTTFSLNCEELGARTSLGLITSKQPYTTFRESNDIELQQIQYSSAEDALNCPVLTAQSRSYNGPALS